jgi:Bacterial conjugation TrbI-like protein
MKTMLLSRLAVVVIAAAAAGQTAPAPSSAAQQGTAPPQDSAAQAQSSSQFPAGTIIPAELSKTVDAKKAKVGDKIEAKVPVDLLSHGKIVIPKNTKIIGHVTEAKAHSKESPDSMVGIAFDRISMKDGREVPIQAAVQAIARPLQSAALSNTASDTGGMPSGGTPTYGGGGGMGGARPPERVASYPGGTPTGTDPSLPQSGTIAPLGPTSQGVVGMKGLSLKVSGQASVISSETENVHLDSGTQLMLRTQ